MKLSKFIKGLCVGIANILPGFCSGTMAIILKVYDDYLSVFKYIFIHPIKTIKMHFHFIFGIFAGLLACIVIINRLIIDFPIISYLFFCGLVIGSLPEGVRMRKNFGNFGFKDFIIIFISGLILMALSTLPKRDLNVEIDLYYIIILIVIGAITSVAMVVPGVSGSLILMSLGYYHFILSKIVYIVSNGIIFNYTNQFWLSVLVILAFCSGLIIGLIFITNAILKVMNKKPKIFNSSILGLMIFSPLALVYRIFNDNDLIKQIGGPIDLIIPVVFLIIGIFISLIFQKLNNNKHNLES